MPTYTIFGVIISVLAHISAAKDQRHVLKRKSARNLQKTCSRWKKIGYIIKGAEKGDESGSAVALSSNGEVVAIGAVANGEGGLNAGQVHVHQWKNCKWNQQGQDIIGDPGDKFGSAVAISGDGLTVAVGAVSANNQKGYVAVYKFAEDEKKGKWEQCGIITGENQYDNLGATNAVSMSDNGQIVAFGGNGLIDIQVWKVMRGVIKCTMKALNAPITSNRAGSRSVALSGDGMKVAVGTAAGGKGTSEGLVEVFKYNEVGKGWGKYGPTIYGEADCDNSGEAVSLSRDGEVLAIGAGLNDGMPKKTASGHVRVYKATVKNDISNWDQLGNDINGEAQSDFSGSSVSISDDGMSVAIGAYLNDINGDRSGHVRVYEFKNRKWSQIGEDIDGIKSNSQLGFSVSISSDGKVIATAAPDGSGKHRGYVQVMKLEKCGEGVRCKIPKSPKTKSPKTETPTKSPKTETPTKSPKTKNQKTKSPKSENE